MDNKKFIVFNDSGIKNSISELIDEASKVKAELFKRFIMKKEFESQNLKQFETYVNEFLRFWCDYANGLKYAMRAVEVDNCEEGLNVIEYGYIKGYIYGSYDYASVLQFADGVIKGIKDGKFEKPSDIDDFRDHTAYMAFNRLDPTTAGLLTSVLSDELETVSRKAEILDLKMFEAVRNYNDLFGYRDRPELYRAITKMLQYITTTGDILPNSDDHTRMRLFISMINNIVEYITYSLTVYATRIYVTSKYAEPFIGCNHTGDTALTESVSLTDISEDPNGAVCSVFHNTDELIVKDPKRYRELIDRIDEFLTLIGSGTIFKDENKNYREFNIDMKWKNDNELYNLLKVNPFYNFFTNAGWFDFSRDRETSMVEMNNTLKVLMYNGKPGAEVSITPRNEFLNIIRKVEYGSTLKDYQKLARDVSVIAIDIADKIRQAMNDKSWQLEDELTGGHWKPGTRKAVAECIKFLIDIYEETLFVFIQKAGYIERRVNQLRSSDVKKTIDITSLNIPGITSDISADDSMMLSIPTTSKMLVENVDMFARPIFESYEMYDDYLRSLPEFTNDAYLKEVSITPSPSTSMKDKFIDKAGTAISTVINKLKSLLQALWQRVQAFWNSKSFALSKKWVIENEEMLNAMQFPADAKIEVLPYKDDINLPKGFENLQKNLMNFNEQSVASPDALQKYLATLYPSAEIAKWFADDTDGKTAAQQYMNLILFDEGSNKPKDPIVITGADIGKKMLIWINTVKESDATQAGFKKINDDIDNAVGSIKSKLVAMSNQSKQNAASQQAPDTSSTNAADASKVDDPTKNPKPQPQQATPPTNPANPLDDASVRISSAISRVWAPVAPMIIRAMMNQYGYIKAAYSLGQSSAQGHKPEGAAQPQQKGQL